MLLQNSLYHIIARNDASYTIRFDASHSTFAGHFPGYPIVPGACLVQIAQELLSEHLGQTVCFTLIQRLKFRQPITPQMEVRYVFADDKITIENTDDSTQYVSFAASYMCTHSDV